MGHSDRSERDNECATPIQCSQLSLRDLGHSTSCLERQEEAVGFGRKCRPRL